jgi:hypothetical protein
VIGIAVSTLAVLVLLAVKGIVDVKASKLKRLRTEADEARINLPSFICPAIGFLVRSRESKSVMEGGNAIVADQWSRGRFRRGCAFVIESTARQRRNLDRLKRKFDARV